MIVLGQPFRRSLALGFGGATAASGPDPETASAIIAGAGSATSNGEYLRDGESNGRAAFSLNLNTLFWNGFGWYVNDSVVGGASYSSSDDVAFPWLATTWVVEDGSEPVPTVTMG